MRHTLMFTLLFACALPTIAHPDCGWGRADHHWNHGPVMEEHRPFRGCERPIAPPWTLERRVDFRGDPRRYDCDRPHRDWREAAPVVILPPPPPPRIHEPHVHVWFGF